MNNPMKVLVTFRLAVDAEAWQEEYGLERGEVRADVKDYAISQVRDSYAVQAGLIEVKS